MSLADDAAAADAALAAAVSKPARVSGDAGSVESHSLPDLVAADRYLAAKVAANTRRRGLRFNTLVPDSTVGGRHYPDPWRRGL